ncbi:retinoic acid receptor RXR-alpha-A-like isoform X2 [Lytechinus variegatus]|uniref:retinoic acid receptor RXR-alpha-A-like isoform X2 n=1 Tax=Lytechinus variegatus TaxID=7654 RepID=UPI001BB1114C|nr:retinoic acid receptor RXR-alpha-A-like isoform X2 [Lytechinus variegatus]
MKSMPLGSMQLPTSTMGSPSMANQGLSSPTLSSPGLHSGITDYRLHSPPMQSPTLTSQGSMEDIKPIISSQPSSLPLSQSQVSSMTGMHAPLNINVQGHLHNPFSQPAQSSISPGSMPGTSINKSICAVCGDRASGKVPSVSKSCALYVLICECCCVLACVQFGIHVKNNLFYFLYVCLHMHRYSTRYVPFIHC